MDKFEQNIDTLLDKFCGTLDKPKNQLTITVPRSAPITDQHHVIIVLFGVAAFESPSAQGKEFWCFLLKNGEEIWKYKPQALYFDANIQFVVVL
mgnify:CR=1 FL=1